MLDANQISRIQAELAKLTAPMSSASLAACMLTSGETLASLHADLRAFAKRYPAVVSKGAPTLATTGIMRGKMVQRTIWHPTPLDGVAYKQQASPDSTAARLDRIEAMLARIEVVLNKGGMNYV